MIYTAIVEDNKRDAERLLSFQERYGKEHKLVQQCQWFSDAEKFLKSDTWNEWNGSSRKNAAE